MKLSKITRHIVDSINELLLFSGQEQQAELHPGKALCLPYHLPSLALQLHHPVSSQGVCAWRYW